MVASKHFAELSANKFSFYGIDIASMDQLDPAEKKEIQTLKEKHKVVETPSILFLNPENMEKKYLHLSLIHI